MHASHPITTHRHAANKGSSHTPFTRLFFNWIPGEALCVRGVRADVQHGQAVQAQVWVGALKRGGDLNCACWGAGGAERRICMQLRDAQGGAAQMRVFLSEQERKRLSQDWQEGGEQIGGIKRWEIIRSHVMRGKLVPRSAIKCVRLGYCPHLESASLPPGSWLWHTPSTEQVRASGSSSQMRSPCTVGMEGPAQHYGQCL